jgi:hypothetical protein
MGQKLKAVMLTIGAAALAGPTLTACQTISEESCLSGSWEDIGFKDGEAGRSRSRLADIAETCAEYNVVPDRTAYIRGLEMGLRRYCGSYNGFEAGRDGHAPNAECEAGGFFDYLDAHAEGYAVYEIERERDQIVSRWKDRDKAYRNVVARLDNDDLDAKERNRLEKKADRLLRQMDNLRIDIRALERLHDLPRWRPPVSD